MDPGNRLLWRANIQRLEFEALRDSLLAIGGSLDERLYGRPVNLERNADSLRRTIYGTVDRSDVLDVLLNFDFANPDIPNGKPYETFVPQQALFLRDSPVRGARANRGAGTGGGRHTRGAGLCSRLRIGAGQAAGLQRLAHAGACQFFQFRVKAASDVKTGHRVQQSG